MSEVNDLNDKIIRTIEDILRLTEEKCLSTGVNVYCEVKSVRSELNQMQLLMYEDNFTKGNYEPKVLLENYLSYLNYYKMKNYTGREE